MENNLITYIPPFIGRMESLENLCLGSNYINEIPLSIQYLTNLKQLKLGLLTKPIVNGAFLEPGQITMSCTPLTLHISMMLCAKGILG